MEHFINPVSPLYRFNTVLKRSRGSEDVVGAKPPLTTTTNTSPAKSSLMCRNNELYAMHQRQLQLRKEQQHQKSLSALSSSTGILLGSSAQAGSTNSPCAIGGGSNTGAGGVDGGADNMMSPPEMDFQVESPMLGGDNKTGISTADDEGGGVGENKNKTESLMTIKGLEPSINDLENLFDDNMMDDNSNDESVSGCCYDCSEHP